MILWTSQTAWSETPPITGPAQVAAVGPLAEYVRAPDASYAWSVRRRGDLGTGRYAELILTSQTWRDQTWRHQLFFYKPAKVKDASRALLLVGGGAWNDEFAQPAAADAALPREAGLLATAADALGVPVVLVLQVPHQPIFGELYEDAAISHTFREFVRSGDDTWPLLLPMVKSAVRAMDCAAQFARDEWKIEPKKFTVTGASKRGWTTWLTAAVDPRVECLAPMVIDMLNLRSHLRLQLDSWGGYSDEIHDYTDLGIHKLVETPAGDKLLEIVDPYSYRKQITQPKLLLFGTNDRYWPLESLNQYWPELAGEKYICYVPNNGHGLKDLGRVLGGISALHRHAAGDLVLPKLVWEHADHTDGAELVLRCDRAPTEVLAWQTTSVSRDFREGIWKAESVASDDGAFRYRLPTPKAGCGAFFCEAKFTDPALTLPYYLSTTIKVVGIAAKPKPR